MTATDSSEPAVPETWRTHFDHFDPRHATAPFAVWDGLRSACPISWSDAHDGFYVATGYDAVGAIARRPDVFSSRIVLVPVQERPEDTEPGGSTPPITSDPPFHTAFRKALEPLFSPRRVAELEPHARALATELVDRLVDRDHCDLGRDYARLIPIGVIAVMLGVEREDADRFTEWIHLLLETNLDDSEGLERARGEVRAYFEDRIAERRATPRDDLIGRLLEVEIDGVPMTDEVLHNAVRLLLVAGIDTTWSVLGSALLHLAQDHERRSGLAGALDDVVVWKRAVEEFLRAFASVSLGRVVTEDTEVDGVRLDAGRSVLLVFPAANRDPAVFERPDELVFEREMNRHYTFGVGIHRCLGSTLARMEIRVALQELLRRIPDFRLRPGTAVEWAVGLVQGPRSFTVELGPGPAAPRPSG